MTNDTNDCDTNGLIRLKDLPFRLATTSFIYPDRMAPNVRKLGPWFDEIELLIFESLPFIDKSGVAHDVLPSADEIEELKVLSERFNLTYNVHLPVDISLTASSKRERDLAVDGVKQVIDRCAPLYPTTHTLHLDFAKAELWGTMGRDENLAVTYPFTGSHELRDRMGREERHGTIGRHGTIERHSTVFFDDPKVRQWQERAIESLTLLTEGLDDPSILSVETLHYPFELLDGILDACGVSVCVDAGHLMKYGYDIHLIFDRYRGRIPLIHLHGVAFPHISSEKVLSSSFNGRVSKKPYLQKASHKDVVSEAMFPKDHQRLDTTPPEILSPIVEILKHYTGTVSLEVFKVEDLMASLRYLERIQSLGFTLF